MTGSAVRSPDVIVVGGGIAGCEAALACARAGHEILLVSTSLDTVYNLASDRVALDPPAGTLMAALAPRAAGKDGRISSWTLHCEVKYALEAEPKLHLLQSNVTGLLLEQGAAAGVTTWEGIHRPGGVVVLCAGSFLGARLQVGLLEESAGRLSEMAYDDLFLGLEALGFAFEPLRLEAPADDARPPYSVSCRVFAPSERRPGGFRLQRMKGLYAAGVCASGYLGYEEAAAQGLALATEILQDLEPGQSPSSAPEGNPAEPA